MGAVVSLSDDSDLDDADAYIAELTEHPGRLTDESSSDESSSESEPIESVSEDSNANGDAEPQSNRNNSRNDGAEGTSDSQSVESDSSLSENGRGNAERETEEENIPRCLKRKIDVLEQIQLEQANLETQFLQELNKLEEKYNKMYTPLYEKRQKIISGEVELANEKWNSIPNGENTSPQIELIDLADSGSEEGSDTEAFKGIPGFWLRVFQNAPVVSKWVYECDKPILKHLIAVKVMTDTQPRGFHFEFHFEPNEFFKNKVLTKHYELQCKTRYFRSHVLLDGQDIVKCKGCVIEWKKGKNVTKKIVKKRVRSFKEPKGYKVYRIIREPIPNNSFFNFFSPPTAPDDANEEMIEDLRHILSSDIEVANMLKRCVIPQALLFYKGDTDGGMKTLQKCEEELEGDDELSDEQEKSDEEVSDEQEKEEQHEEEELDEKLELEDREELGDEQEKQDEEISNEQEIEEQREEEELDDKLELEYDEELSDEQEKHEGVSGEQETGERHEEDENEDEEEDQLIGKEEELDRIEHPVREENDQVEEREYQEEESNNENEQPQDGEVLNCDEVGRDNEERLENKEKLDTKTEVVSKDKEERQHFYKLIEGATKTDGPGASRKRVWTTLQSVKKMKKNNQ